MLLLLLLGAAARPALGESTPSPGPPIILSEGEVGDHWLESADWERREDELALLEDQLAAQPVITEITAVVSRSPGDDWTEEANSTEEPEDLSPDQPPGSGDPLIEGPLLLLAWWQLLLLALACALVCCLCAYLTGCCFLTVDCCADPYWGCCAWLRPCVRPLKPPPHVSHGLQRKETHLSTTYSLNESSTAPRRSVERSARSVVSDRGSCRSVRSSSTPLRPEAPARDSASTPFLAAAEDTATLATSTLQSGKSVRNYKRPATATPRLGAGLSESQPHVYGETGSYFSWLHLLGRSSKRYTVTTPRKQHGAATNNNKPIYRQNTRYRHIPDNSRNSAVIPTKISKRSSTASNFNGRPYLNKRSRSAETVDSLEDGPPGGPLEASRSERHIPRSSRLSANLATLEAGRSERSIGTPVACPTAPLLLEYNLRTFEKSLLKSKETTL